MDLSLSGHPLHTRLQTVGAHLGAGGEISVDGRHLDVRKRGFVPVGSDLQASGVIHQMSVRAGLDLDSRVLTDVVSEMAVPAFEPSALTGGESCRDVAGPRPGLRHLPLDAATAAAVSDAMGGVRGCSHVLALTQLVASAIGGALASSAEWRAGPPRRLFQRTLVIDGAQPDEGSIELAVQLSDIFFTTAAGVVNPMDRFAHQHEVRVLARVELGTVVLSALEVAERTRDRTEIAGAAWRRRDDAVSDLLTVPFLGGFAKRVLALLGEHGADRPLADALLALAPTFIQVCGCFSEDWPGRCLGVDTLVGVGGVPDACYMWRRSGALHARKRPTDPIGKV